jgi:hypothetical protein
MSKAPQWSTEAPPGLDLGSTTIDQANEIVGAAGYEPLPRGTLNALYRAGWGAADLVIYGEAKELMFKNCIGVKRMGEVDAWRTALLSVVTPDGEAMTTAERVIINLMRRKVPEVREVPTAALVEEVREHGHTEHLRELLLELALLVPPRLDGPTRQWLLEVARG